MKIISLLIVCFISIGVGYAQEQPVKNSSPSIKDDEQLYAKITQEICSCLQNQSAKSSLMDNFPPCVEKGMEKYKQDLITFLTPQMTDSSYEAGYETGHILAEKLLPGLVNSCDIFYNELMDYIEASIPIHNKDSLQFQMSRVQSMLAAGDSLNNTYFYKALLHYRLGEYKIAAKIFRRAYQISPTPVFALYALAMERKQKSFVPVVK